MADHTVEDTPAPQPAGQMQPDLVALHTRVTELEQEARALVRGQPAVAVLAAAGVGYLVARLVVRGTR